MKNILLMIITCLCLQTLSAQGVNFVVSYPIAFPTSDLNNYVSHTSFRGLSLEFNRKQKENLEVGLETGWNVFYQREDADAYSKGTSTISGIQYRYTNAVPILAGAKYYLKAGKGQVVKPYVGLGVGTLYVNRATDFGLYRITTEDWQFCIRPETGILLSTGGGVAGLIGVKYYAAFNSEELNAQSYVTINVGVVFSAR